MQVCVRAYVCNFSVSIYSCTFYLVCCLLLDSWQETENKKYVLYSISTYNNYIVKLHYVSLLSVYTKGSSKQDGVTITETGKSTATCWHLNESVSANLQHFFYSILSSAAVNSLSKNTCLGSVAAEFYHVLKMQDRVPSRHTRTHAHAHRAQA
jgi:hypothetical protein